MKKLSIIIVTHNSEKDIWECLKSIYDNNDLGEGELDVVVVDNDSIGQDKMFAKIHSTYKDIKTIRNDKNGGYGQGNNIGIRNSTSPVILIMNPDVRLTMPCFRKVTMAFEHDRKLTMYGMKQKTGNNEPSWNSFCCNSFVNGYLASLITIVCNRLDLYIPSLLFFSGACFFIRKSHFVKAGLFDEDIFMYGEENDIHHRLKTIYGARFKYDRSISYKHLVQDRKFNPTYEDKVLNSTIKVCEKYGYSMQKTVRNKIQVINMLILREKIKRLLFLKHNKGFLCDLQQYKKTVECMRRNGKQSESGNSK